MIQFSVQEKELRQVTPLGADYMQGDRRVMDFFHYHPYEAHSYQQRMQDVFSRTYPREQLSAVIQGYMENWGLTQAVSYNIERLKKDDALVVIGGQQAGLLTGPLYTVYKAITILQLAREQERQLGVPVIPIFWIAGEDHDFLEINHVYQPAQAGAHLEKIHLENAAHQDKRSACHRPLPKEETKRWINHLFEEQIQTEFSQDLQKRLKNQVDHSQTYVDFFTGIMHDIFGAYGLLMVQSGDPHLRELESETFRQIIHHYDEIDADVRSGVQQVREAGYDPQVQLADHPALLFVYEKQERLLMEKLGETFQTKDGRYQYMKEEMMEIADHEPWRLSNNVITRPLMQESLFPTLAFVGGAGEIAYWALYKNFFDRFRMRMPIISPRISMTLVEKPVAKIMEKREIDLDTIFSDFQAFRKQWLAEQDQLQLNETFTQTKNEIKNMYEPLVEKIATVDPGLENLGHKNLAKVLEQVEYLQKRSTQAQERQHEAALRQFDKVEQLIFPHEKLQERMYHPFYFFNKHGLQLVASLLQHPFSINGKHKFIYLHPEG